jgi:Ser/Thr protein kinase RdoA (MazF antagonist)
MVLGSRLGVGREAEVFAWGDDAVVKLYRPGFRGHEAESALLRQLDGRGGAPRLIDVVDHGERRGLVLERLPGSDMLTLLQRRPWLLRSLARRLATAHLRIHEIAAPNVLPELGEVLAARIDDAPLPPRLREFAVRELRGLPRGDRLTHGDFHPGNVLAAGDQTSVVDWVGAARGTPEADHARTMLLLRWADPLPGTSPLSRRLIASGRWAFGRSYARHYWSGKPQPTRELASWLTVVAAARMSEGIEVEHPRLLRLIESARRRIEGAPH